MTLRAEQQPIAHDRPLIGGPRHEVESGVADLRHYALPRRSSEPGALQRAVGSRAGSDVTD
jgi:hypothetical protein